MANYRFDIARFIESEAKVNNILKAVVSIQYPIYYIHSEVVDTKPHILYELDKAIINCSKVLNSFNNDDISKLLSLPSSVIKSRKAYLSNNQYLNKKDEITTLGENYTNNEEKKMEHHLSQDFIIDGITLKPLPKELYGTKYKEEYIFERDYYHYTNKDGETVSIRPFSPDLTHQPIQKDIVEINIVNIQVSERSDYNIPLGLKALSSLTYSVCALPIFIGLFENNGGLKRKLINGFDSLGNPDHLNSFLPNLEERITNLELRLNEWKSVNGNLKLNFESNWREIDLNREEDKLFFFSKEDLKNYFNQNYQFVPQQQAWKEDLELNDVFYSSKSLGIIVTQKVFEKANFKKELLKNVRRGSDYYLRNYITSGVWAIFFDFIPGDDFIKNAVEISSLVDGLVKKRLPEEKTKEKIVARKYYRQILVALEEFRLLEEIDMMNHMIILLNE